MVTKLPNDPRLTVAMPVYDAARFVRQAIESVLAQEGVAFELILVDDGSTDGSAAILAEMRDPRIVVLRNEHRLGIGACHNRILQYARAPYLAQVDADDLLLPGALAAMVRALDENPDAALAHCHFFDIDDQGRTTIDDFAARWTLFQRTRGQGMDYRARLARSNVANALRTYRREVFARVGTFDESLRFGVDYDMALRIAENDRIVLVPQFLYARRVHGGNTSEARRFKAIHFGRQNGRIQRALIARGAVTFLRAPRLDVARVLERLARERIEVGWDVMRRRLQRWKTILRWRLVVPAMDRLYRAVVENLPRASLPPAIPVASRPEGSVAYYTSVFPALSETFIQREIEGLREAGVDVLAIARVSGAPSEMGPAARALRDDTVYVDTMEEAKLVALRRRILRRHPVQAARVFAYLLFHRYTASKSLTHDQEVFRRVLAVAGVADEAKATRLHSPWATTDALVALLAARLIGARYTVQARASDLYKRAVTLGLEERLGAAETIVTNAEYNVPTIRAAVNGRPCPPIVQIYEGIDLRQFAAPKRRTEDGSTLRLLCVARLTAPKGIEHLLRAVRFLLDEGCDVRCDIVGGRVANEVNYALLLKRLWRDLALEDRVVFVGGVPFEDVLERYQTADIFVLPAVESADGRRDITPNCVIEAMAMELPIVSSRSGAIAELVDDEESGLLVSPGDVPAIAASIRRLARDKELRRRLGAAGRRKVEGRFDLHRNVRGYVELFRS